MLLETDQHEGWTRRKNHRRYSYCADRISERVLVHSIMYVGLNDSPRFYLPKSPAPSKGLSLTMHGDTYPEPGNSDSTPQSLQVNILCSETQESPKFLGYDGSQLQLEWSHPAGCSTQDNGDGEKGDGGDDAGNPGESVGSGLGFFFGMYVLLFQTFMFKI
jgi:hypothetical protein